MKGRRLSCESHMHSHHIQDGLTSAACRSVHSAGLFAIASPLALNTSRADAQNPCLSMRAVLRHQPTSSRAMCNGTVELAPPH